MITYYNYYTIYVHVSANKTYFNMNFLFLFNFEIISNFISSRNITSKTLLHRIKQINIFNESQNSSRQIQIIVYYKFVKLIPNHQLRLGEK